MSKPFEQHNLVINQSILLFQNLLLCMVLLEKKVYLFLSIANKYFVLKFIPIKSNLLTWHSKRVSFLSKQKMNDSNEWIKQIMKEWMKQIINDTNEGRN